MFCCLKKKVPFLCFPGIYTCRLSELKWTKKTAKWCLQTGCLLVLFLVPSDHLSTRPMRFFFALFRPKHLSCTVEVKEFSMSDEGWQRVEWCHEICIDFAIPRDMEFFVVFSNAHLHVMARMTHTYKPHFFLDDSCCWTENCEVVCRQKDISVVPLFKNLLIRMEAMKLCSCWAG